MKKFNKISALAPKEWPNQKKIKALYYIKLSAFIFFYLTTL